MSEKTKRQEAFPELNAKLRGILEIKCGHQDQDGIGQFAHGFDVWDVQSMMDIPHFIGPHSERILESIMFLLWVILNDLSEEGFIIPVFPNKMAWPKKKEPWLYGGEFFRTVKSIEKRKEK